MKKKGFTLIELLIALAILGILAAIAVLGYQNIAHSLKEKACQSNRQAIAHAIQNQENLKGAHITNLADIAYFFPDMPKCPLGGKYIWIDRTNTVYCSHEIRELEGIVYQFNPDMDEDAMNFNGYQVQNVPHNNSYNLSEGGTIHVSMDVEGPQNPWAGIVHKGTQANTNESYSLQLLGAGELAICLKTETPNTYRGNTYAFVVLKTEPYFFNDWEKTSITATWQNEPGKKSVFLYKNGQKIEDTELWLYNFPQGKKIRYEGDINSLNLKLLDNEGDLLLGNQNVNAHGTAAFRGKINTVNIIAGAMSEEEVEYHLSIYNP